MAMFDDDRPTKPTSVHQLGQELDALSIAELEARIELLRAEIARLEGVKAKKAAQRIAAAGVFKT